MSRAPRAVALIAVLALPLGAALATYLLSTDPEPPRSPAIVRIGENPPGRAGPTPTPSAGTTTPAPSRTRTPPAGDRTFVPPPPPVDDDDDDDADDD